MSGPMTLCGRSDLYPDRFFSGHLSNLMLFDTGLNPGQVAALFHEYQRQAVLFPIGRSTREGRASQALSDTSTSGRRCCSP